jgi:hypothetical protein
MARIGRLACFVLAGLLAVPGLRASAPNPSTPLRATDLWLAPMSESASKAPLASAVDLLASGRPAVALPLLSKAVADPVLGGYAVLYKGRALLALGGAAEAAAAAGQLLSAHPSGYLNEAALLLAADAAEASGDWPAGRCRRSRTSRPRRLSGSGSASAARLSRPTTGCSPLRRSRRPTMTSRSPTTPRPPRPNC